MNLPIKILTDKDDNKFIPVTSSNAVIFPDGKNLTDKIKNGKIGLPDNIIVEEDGLYQIKDNAVYPIANPDISTQPSILPQRFGNLPIYEVLIANGKEEEIPINATVISAFSFKNNVCVPAVVRKDYKLIKPEITFNNAFPCTIADLPNVVGQANFDVTLDDLRKYLTFYTNGSTNITIRKYSDSIYMVHYNNAGYHQVIISDNTISFEGNYISDVVIEDYFYNDSRKSKLPIKHWTIYNDEDIIPDFTLVRYFGGKQEDYYNYAYNHNNNDTAKSPFYKDLNIETSDYAVFTQSIFTEDNCYGVSINSIPYKVLGIIHSNNNATYYVAINNNNEFVIYNSDLTKVGDFVLGTEGYEAQYRHINKGSVFELLNPKPDAVTKFIIPSTQSESNTWLNVNINSFGCEDINAGANIGYATLVRNSIESYYIGNTELVVQDSGSTINIEATYDNYYNDRINIYLSRDISSTQVYSTSYPILIEFKAKLGT